MNLGRISQLRHSSGDPANDSPNNSASPSSSTTFHPSAPTPPSSHLPLSLNPAHLLSLCEYQPVVMTCTRQREKERPHQNNSHWLWSGSWFSQIRLLPTKNICSHFRKRWASGFGVSEDREKNNVQVLCTGSAYSESECRTCVDVQALSTVCMMWDKVAGEGVSVL